MLFKDIFIYISGYNFAHPRETLLCNSGRGHYKENFYEIILNKDEKSFEVSYIKLS